MPVDDLQRSPMMSHLLDALERGEDLGHYGRLTFAMVARVPLFVQLEVSTIARLVGVLRALKISSGQHIVTRGETADGMYFIASGEVEIILPERRVRLSEGDFFGEVALLMPDTTRTATVIAIRTCELLKLEQRDFQNLLERHVDGGHVVEV